MGGIQEVPVLILNEKSVGFFQSLHRIEPMKNLLAIETSGPLLSVAVKKGRQRVREATIKGFSRHAENLMPLIDRLLRKEKLKLQSIDAFLIGRGPGSFTGLRVGFSTMKGLISSGAKPCYGALSLDLIAGEIPGLEGENLNVCLDAKRGKLYTRLYRYHKQKWDTQTPAAALSLNENLKQLPEGTWLAGEGLSCYLKNRELLPARKFRMLPKRFWHPRASTLIKWFETKNPMLRLLNKPAERLPVYFRSSEAEERLAQKEKS